jgi:hypothetical protein
MLRVDAGNMARNCWRQNVIFLLLLVRYIGWRTAARRKNRAGRKGNDIKKRLICEKVQRLHVQTYVLVSGLELVAVVDGSGAAVGLTTCAKTQCKRIKWIKNAQ